METDVCFYLTKQQVLCKQPQTSKSKIQISVLIHHNELQRATEQAQPE